MTEPLFIDQCDICKQGTKEARKHWALRWYCGWDCAQKYYDRLTILRYGSLDVIE